MFVGSWREVRLPEAVQTSSRTLKSVSSGAPPPSDAERMEPVSRIGGEAWKFEPFRDGRAGEHVGLSESTVGSDRHRGTAMVSPIHTTVEAAEERIGALIGGLDTSSRNYEFAAAVHYGGSTLWRCFD